MAVKLLLNPGQQHMHEGVHRRGRRKQLGVLTPRVLEIQSGRLGR